MFGREKIEYKTPEQVRAMRRAGLVVADIHAALRAAVAPGMTTADLDAVSAEVLERAGARSNFLGYQGFPATACISVNEEIVHGIPGDRVIQDGDVVSFDCGAVVDGWHGDAAFSMVVGHAAAEDLALVETTEAAMWAGIAALATGEPARRRRRGRRGRRRAGQRRARPAPRDRRGVRRPRHRHRDAPAARGAQLPHPGRRARGCARACACASSR